MQVDFVWMLSDLLKMIKTEALATGKYDIPREGLFRCALRASFVRAYQFALYCNKIEGAKADEGAFQGEGYCRLQ